jgi:hypothetical protein
MTELEVLGRIQEALLPFDVYLKWAELSLADDFDPKRSPQPLGFQIRHDVGRDAVLIDLPEAEASDRTARALRYMVETGVRFTQREGSADNAEPTVRAEIEASWIVEYRIKKAEDVDQAGIDAFRENGNVMYHVWPYWREFIHASCARLRLPQVILPMFRVAKRVPRKAAPPVAARPG